VETKGELDLEDLQQWQKDILIDSYNKDIEAWENTYTIIPKEEELEIPLTLSQAKMLEKVLGDEFFITDSKVRDILEAVFECGFYYERDRKLLNWARDCYLKGKNWIKRMDV
jgi:hypothetical protein